jgi:signal transduction histidine kinase
VSSVIGDGAMFRRLRWRLVVANVLVIAGILVALGVAVLGLMDRLLVDQQATTLLNRATEASTELRFDPRDFVARLGGPESGTFYALWDGTGALVAETAQVAAQALRPAAEAAASGAGASTRTTVTLPSGPALVVSLPLDDGQGVVQAGSSLQPVRDAEAQLTLLILGVGGVGLLLAVVAAWFLADRSMVPIRRAFERQREFTADASHELRTPLSVIDAGLQVLERHPEQPVSDNAEVVGAMRQQANEMARLVGGLLTLARADAGAAQLRLAEVDIDALVRGVADSFRPLAEERGAGLDVSSTSAERAVVDADRIRELIGILIDNAIEHGGAGVHVSLAARRIPGQIEIEVADDGPGIPATDRARVFERFRRGDTSRTGRGLGLGLAIASWIADAHHGRLTLEDNGPGLRVRLSVPV